jgi:hypothetical protein
LSEQLDWISTEISQFFADFVSFDFFLAFVVLLRRFRSALKDSKATVLHTNKQKEDNFD